LHLLTRPSRKNGHNVTGSSCPDRRYVSSRQPEQNGRQIKAEFDLFEMVQRRTVLVIANLVAVVKAEEREAAEVQNNPNSLLLV